MCQLCRRIGIIELPASAYNAKFYLDGSVDINHGMTSIPFWSSTDDFYYFHSLLMVGRTTPIAAKYAQHLWAQKLDDFEKKYMDISKELDERKKSSQIDSIASEENLRLETRTLTVSLLEQNVLGVSVSEWVQTANERTPPRKIYGLPSPQKTKKRFSKSQKKKWARNRREIAQRI